MLSLKEPFPWKLITFLSSWATEHSCLTKPPRYGRGNNNRFLFSKVITSTKLIQFTRLDISFPFVFEIQEFLGTIILKQSFQTLLLFKIIFIQQPLKVRQCRLLMAFGFRRIYHILLTVSNFHLMVDLFQGKKLGEIQIFQAVLCKF